MRRPPRGGPPRVRSPGVSAHRTPAARRGVDQIPYNRLSARPTTVVAGDSMSYRLGVDVGARSPTWSWSGPDGQALTRKVLSSTGRLRRGDRRGHARAAVGGRHRAPADLGELIHGTTVATNAILERRGRARRGSSRPRASATSSRSGGSGWRACTTSTSSGRPRWSRAAGGRPSSSASTPGRGPVPLDRQASRRRSTCCTREGVESIAIAPHPRVRRSAPRAGRRRDCPRAGAGCRSDALVGAPARGPRVRANRARPSPTPT